MHNSYTTISLCEVAVWSCKTLQDDEITVSPSSMQLRPRHCSHKLTSVWPRSVVDSMQIALLELEHRLFPLFVRSAFSAGHSFVAPPSRPFRLCSSTARRAARHSRRCSLRCAVEQYAVQLCARGCVECAARLTSGRRTDRERADRQTDGHRRPMRTDDTALVASSAAAHKCVTSEP